MPQSPSESPCPTKGRAYRTIASAKRVAMVLYRDNAYQPPVKGDKIMKSRTISCTCTVGAGSERHNHDLDYRATLKHVHGSPDGVLELIPYHPYREQINELVKPYIDEYNIQQQQRYQEAWDRYNKGEIKTKPRKRNYEPMSYDYYTDHVHDVYYNRATKKTEPVKLWRSLIFGIGDKEDRTKETITRQEAIDVMSDLVARWPIDFPAFKLLGASIHLDEHGFYHCHIDYFPFFKNTGQVKQEQGLRVSHSQEAALEHMGFQPEQSIINASDKIPIRFNAFRNRIYIRAEEELDKRGIRLEYGVSKFKDPTKDSSTNQQLKHWQDTQDGIISAQKYKNHMLDIVEKDTVTPDEIKDALKAAYDMEQLLTTVSQQKRSRFKKDHVEVHFSLFDQIKSVIEHIVKAVAHLLQRIYALTDDLCKEQDRTEILQKTVDQQAATIERYKESNHQLQFKVNKYSEAAIENESRKRYMAQFSISDIPMEQKFREFRHQEMEK